MLITFERETERIETWTLTSFEKVLSIFSEIKITHLDISDYFLIVGNKKGSVQIINLVTGEKKCRNGYEVFDSLSSYI